MSYSGSHDCRVLVGWVRFGSFRMGRDMGKLSACVELRMSDPLDQRVYRVFLHDGVSNDRAVYSVSTASGTVRNSFARESVIVSFGERYHDAALAFDRAVQRKIKQGFVVNDCVGEVPKLGFSIGARRRRRRLGSGGQAASVYDKIIASLGGVSEW